MVGICRHPEMLWVLQLQGDRYVVKCYNESSGQLLSTQQISPVSSDPLPFQKPFVRPVPFYVDSKGRKYIANGTTLYLPFNEAYLFHNDGHWSSERGAIQSLSGVTFERDSRIVVTFESGVAVVWFNGLQFQFLWLEEDFTNPVAAFTRRGQLIIADRSNCVVFNADNNQLRFHARGDELPSQPIAVLPAPHLDQFALVTASGQARLFEVPRS